MDGTENVRATTVYELSTVTIRPRVNRPGTHEQVSPLGRDDQVALTTSTDLTEQLRASRSATGHLLGQRN
jgi:hypothetical protein